MSVSCDNRTLTTLSLTSPAKEVITIITIFEEGILNYCLTFTFTDDKESEVNYNRH